MKICLIGQNLTNLILASIFEEKKLNVDIYLNKRCQNIKTKESSIYEWDDNSTYVKKPPFFDNLKDSPDGFKDIINA